MWDSETAVMIRGVNKCMVDHARYHCLCLHSRHRRCINWRLCITELNKFGTQQLEANLSTSESVIGQTTAIFFNIFNMAHWNLNNLWRLIGVMLFMGLTEHHTISLTRSASSVFMQLSSQLHLHSYERKVGGWRSLSECWWRDDHRCW